MSSPTVCIIKVWLKGGRTAFGRYSETTLTFKKKKMNQIMILKLLFHILWSRGLTFSSASIGFVSSVWALLYWICAHRIHVNIHVCVCLCLVGINQRSNSFSPDTHAHKHNVHCGSQRSWHWYVSQTLCELGCCKAC